VHLELAAIAANDRRKGVAIPTQRLRLELGLTATSAYRADAHTFMTAYRRETHRRLEADRHRGKPSGHNRPGGIDTAAALLACYPGARDLSEQPCLRPEDCARPAAHRAQRENLDDPEAALEEARVVLEATQRERWIANTLAGLAEVALLRGDVERASALLVDARDRYAARDDTLGVADVEERLRGLAKDPLNARKGAPDTTVRHP
jgi:hypothetical protein